VPYTGPRAEAVAEAPVEPGDFEDAIGRLARSSVHPEAYENRMPTGGEHVITQLEQPMVTADDLGKITAEAVKTSYEETAKAIASLGVEAAKRVTEIEQLKAKQEELSKACLELADQYRKEGEKQAKAIADASTHLDACRDWIGEMRKKLMGESK
jgi:hypothetical protein